jgi:tetratricopeptide (TPR) repeat protein
MQIVNAQDISLAVSVDRFAALRPGPLRTLAEWDGGPSKSRIARPVARWMYSTGLELLWRSNYEDALGYFEKAADKEADRAETWLQIGYCRANLNQHEAAIRAYRRAIRLKPDYTEAYNKLGDAYYCTGQRREAVEAYRKVVELNPGIASAHYNLGLTQLELGNRQAALEQHKLLLTLDPGLAGELYRLIEK